VKDGVTKREVKPTAEAARGLAIRTGREKVSLRDDSLTAKQRRMATEQLIIAPREEELEPLLAQGRRTPAEDATLRHATKLAVRAALRLPGALEKVPTQDGELAAIIRTLHTPAAAQWLLGFLRQQAPAADELASQLRSLARSLPASEVPALIALVRERVGQDVAMQADLAPAVAEGLAERGEVMPPALLSWAAEVAAKLLAEHARQPEPEWSEAVCGWSDDVDGQQPAAAEWRVGKAHRGHSQQGISGSSRAELLALRAQWSAGGSLVGEELCAAGGGGDGRGIAARLATAP
jgi:hypothetical protein